MSGALTIRPACWSDRGAILELTLAMGGHEDVARHADPMRRLGAVLRRSDARVLVAVCEAEVVGFAEVQARPTSLDDVFGARLTALAVAPESRGSGIGKALLAAVDDAARELGCVRIDLESSQRRGSAHAFYRASGYEQRTAAERFRRVVPPLVGASLEALFLEAAALAACAVSAAIVELDQADAVGLGADGAPTEAADRAAEHAAVEALGVLGLPIVSEEHGLFGPAPRADDPWIALDPLDGSRNFRARYPPYAIAVGLVQSGEARAGLVCELVSGRRWTARAGHGALADGRPIRAGRGGLVGLPSPSRERAISLPSFADRIRISGSTATDLCRVADGSLAAFDALGRRVVHVHDLAGPLAILHEAGALVLDRTERTPRLIPDPRVTFEIVAAADRELARELLAPGRASRTAALRQP
jgi:3'(2'), 5'-bisphosphate nucleotidase